MTTPKTKPASWSFSRLSDFSKCRFMYKLKYLDKVPEPERVLRKGQVEFANDRGTRVHSNIEEYVRGEHDALCDEANKHFGVHIDFLRHQYEAGNVEMEESWAYDRDWEVADWDTGWLRMKIDALVHVSKYDAFIVDFKTGRHAGNEVGHASQLHLYAASTFLRYPELEEVSVADWYLDHDLITEKVLTRDQALRFKPGFDKQGKTLTDCKDFPTNANRFSCRWCCYSQEGTGHCQVGVKTVAMPKSRK